MEAATLAAKKEKEKEEAAAAAAAEAKRALEADVEKVSAKFHTPITV